MKLKFTKMQGAGNDFVVIDAIGQSVAMTPRLAARLADRHFGVGCDQILVVERPSGASADFRYRIWNADGGEVEQCGNGARCFVRFVRDRGLTTKDEIRVETLSGVIAPRMQADGRVSVDMGAPIFQPERVPFVAQADAPVHVLEIAGNRRELSVLSMGNPHAVQFVPDLDAAPVTSEGPLIENHPRFPRRVNAGYAQILDRRHIRLRVWERGAGETLACGTGACAAVVAGVRRGLLDARTLVSTRGGDLTIEWRGGDNPVWMTGPALSVFEGEIDIDQS
jgi:diaminopimelate epimerase